MELLKSRSKDHPTNRILTHAEDCLTVCREEGIKNVYVMGSCLGHPFAAGFVLRALEV